LNLDKQERCLQIISARPICFF